MQNWNPATNMQMSANNGFLDQSIWYNQLFAANIKTEPGTNPTPPPQPTQLPAQHSPSQLETYLKHQQLQYQQQQQQQQSPHHSHPVAVMTPSPSNNGEFFDSASMQQHQQQLLQQQMQQHQQQLLQQQMQQQLQQQQLQQQQYQQHFQQAQQAAAKNQASSHLPLAFNPLTPPGLPNAVLPAMSHFYMQQRQQQQTPSPQPMTSSPCEVPDKSALTPRNTPPMDTTPPNSVNVESNPNGMVVDPQPPQTQDTTSNSSEELKKAIESAEDAAIRNPVYNSHGKLKNHRCKVCGDLSITKLAFWEHARCHMKPEKLMQCPKCPFATELKHHLEYHVRKHKNIKPFRCEECSYTCVNKSMLNSHRKSHSSIYQYRCADCDYATKYCHSFKLHLRKYTHKPGVVLDENGVPNPSVVIDVYGTRRGPKKKKSAGKVKVVASDPFMPSSPPLTAKLEGFPGCNEQKQPQASPAKSTSSVTAELPALTLTMSLQEQQELQQQTLQQQKLQQQKLQQQQMQQQQLQQQQLQQQQLQQQQLQQQLLQQQQLQQQQEQQQQEQQQQQQQMELAAQVVAQMSPVAPAVPVNGPHVVVAAAAAAVAAAAAANQQQQLTNLASLLQQNGNMALFPIWNLHVLAAQQQAVLAHLSPNNIDAATDNGDMHEDEEEEAEEDQQADAKPEECASKSLDLAMDLSQGTPTKEDQKPAEEAMNLKMTVEHGDTPVVSSNAQSRRKGRVLKLDAEQLRQMQQTASAPTSPMYANPASPVPNGNAPAQTADECMETAANNQNAALPQANTSASSTASSSGNSSDNSSTPPTEASTDSENPPANPNRIYECKFCDIIFKDDVLYTIHMGYHSCDDAFKCNMCGEKCDGPIGLFVHMARNPHT